MIEKRHLERRKDYEEVIQNVPRWIPWVPKN
jgi:protein-S-isoprenylcysteine O-methyltransferase Ste14